MPSAIWCVALRRTSNARSATARSRVSSPIAFSARTARRGPASRAGLFRSQQRLHPDRQLDRRKAGRLYGTTTYGGAFGNGKAFRLDPPVSGGATWTVAVLASFDWAQGATPVAGLVADARGIFNGTTLSGGTYGLGTMFELKPPAPGRPGWTQTALVSFGATTGVETYGGVLIGKAGKLYGTTYQNGPAGGGRVFELTPPAAAGAPWSQTVLAAFDGANGANPNGGPLADSAGDLYGTTGAEGPSNTARCSGWRRRTTSR